MPTSVPGRIEGTAVPRQAGATLLEMMVVLAIIGIVAGAAGLNLFPRSSDRVLRHEAQRLSWLLPIARAQARAIGQPVIWHHDELGYRFDIAETRWAVPGLMAIKPTLDPALRPRRWETPSAPTVRVEPDGAVLITGEWMPGPLRIDLNDGWRTISILRDAAGHYEVTP